MKRGKSIDRAPWQRPKPVAHYGKEIDQKLREQVFTRANYLCECCGEPLGRADQDSVCNLVALHSLCHRRIHDHPAWATEHGFMVPTSDDPATVAIALHCAAWRLLSLSGGYIDAETGGDAA